MLLESYAYIQYQTNTKQSFYSHRYRTELIFPSKPVLPWPSSSLSMATPGSSAQTKTWESSSPSFFLSHYILNWWGNLPLCKNTGKYRISPFCIIPTATSLPPCPYWIAHASAYSLYTAARIIVLKQTSNWLKILQQFTLYSDERTKSLKWLTVLCTFENHIKNQFYVCTIKYISHPNLCWNSCAIGCQLLHFPMI